MITKALQLVVGCGALGFAALCLLLLGRCAWEDFWSGVFGRTSFRFLFLDCLAWCGGMCAALAGLGLILTAVLGG